MTKIIVRDRPYIEGRGQFLVAHKDDNVGVDLRKLKGSEIEADGKTWKVAAIEGFTLGDFIHPMVGLLVRPLS